MEQAILQFAKENVTALAVMTAWYLLAGVIAALFGRKTRIDEWCEANPGVALVLNFLRATGFDFWKILAALRTLADAKSKLPPIGPALLLIATLAGGSQIGCSRATVDAQIDKAILIEHQVIVQVDYLTTVFDSLVTNPLIPADKRVEYQQKFIEAKQILVAAVDAKDTALRAAKEANAATVDINALVNGIVDAVQKIISVVAMVGASPLFVQEQQTKALTLTRGM